jgi:hypothetical protein
MLQQPDRAAELLRRATRYAKNVSFCPAWRDLACLESSLGARDKAAQNIEMAIQCNQRQGNSDALAHIVHARVLLRTCVKSHFIRD